MKQIYVRQGLAALLVFLAFAAYLGGRVSIGELVICTLLFMIFWVVLESSQERR